MNRIATRFPSAFCRTLLRGASVGFVVLAMLFAASSARAGCGDPRKSGTSPALSWLHNASNSQDNDGPYLPATIVGLWHVNYTAADGSHFLESFDTWHADGTEFENANLPPVVGNICYGVWKQIAPRTVQLHHVGWMFNADGSSAGTFTLDETNTVAQDGKTYKGTFDFKVYDVNGNLGAEVKGTMLAIRITVS